MSIEVELLVDDFGVGFESLGIRQGLSEFLIIVKLSGNLIRALLHIDGCSSLGDVEEHGGFQTIGDAYNCKNNFLLKTFEPNKKTFDLLLVNLADLICYNQKSLMQICLTLLSFSKRAASLYASASDLIAAQKDGLRVAIVFQTHSRSGCSRFVTMSQSGRYLRSSTSDYAHSYRRLTLTSC